MERQQDRLPIIAQDSPPAEEERPSCGPSVYVTNEEAAVAAAMRRLREQAIQVKARLQEAPGQEERAALEQQLATLREERKDLVGHQEQAWRNKMIMLGHLSPDDEW